MAKKYKKKKFPSELRLDLVSKDWVLIATGRARRPETFKRKKKSESATPKKSCPFCKIGDLEKPLLIFAKGKKVGGKNIPSNWSTIVVPNKFPAVLPAPRLDKKTAGKVYQKMNAVGFHEVVITKDHQKSFGQFKLEQIKEVIDVYHERYLGLMNKKFVNYVSIFYNHGAEAGASISHPHSQIITTPLIDVDLSRALANSERYFQDHRKCIYCEMDKWDKKVKERIVFENKDFLVLCPFASKVAFQIIISPKKHYAYFEKITDKEKWQLAEAFRIALGKLYKALNNPSYNFYLHTAPCDEKKHDHYHWHWTILPKTAIWAGFEVGTRVEISTIEPEKAAAYLRKQKVK